MQIRHYIDPETGLPHIYKHGVTEDEVEEVLAEWMEDYRSRRDTRIKTGQTRSGRYVMVVYVIQPNSEVLVLTARQLRRNELAAFRRRIRRRGLR